jgi:seryl-tRNA synthetase
MQLKKQKQLKSIEASNQRVLRIDSPFYAYLETLLETNQEYIEVKDIIARYDTLRTTNTELIARSQKAQDQIEKTKQDFAIKSKQTNNQNLNCNNEISKLHNRIEELKKSSLKWQADLDKHLSSASSKSLQLGQIKM